MSSEHPRNRSGSTGVLLVLMVVVVAVAAAIAAFLVKRGEELPVLGKAPRFELIDQQGRPFSSGLLAGKVWVANFMFTRCANTCPLQAKKLQDLESLVKSVPGLEGEVRLVSLSVDAERDRPEDLEAYAKGQGADPALWVFLTGPPGEVARISQEGFQLAAGSVAGAGEDGAPAITHSDRFVLVDREGRLRGHYRPTADEAEGARLGRDLRRLAGK